MSAIELSKVHPDWSDLVIQLNNELAVKGTWKDMLASSTGQTLLELVSAIGAFNQFHIESAFREAFTQTALRDSSIYAIARMLGVRIARKVPASTRVVMYNKTGVTQQISPYESFAIGGQRFYNNDFIVVEDKKSVEFNIYEGQLKTKVLTLTYTDITNFYDIYLEEPGFIVSNNDFSVRIYDPVTKIGETWERTDQPLWMHGPDDAVYYESTSGDGDVCLTFGDGTYGKIPVKGYHVEINYIVSTGQSGNNGLQGISVAWVTDSRLSGNTIDAITDGFNEKTSNYYRAYSPHIFKARSRAITKTDYLAIIMVYPGVASAVVQGQRDIAPGDVTWMNVIRICILPEGEGEGRDTWGGSNPNPHSAPWDLFLKYLQPRIHACLQIQTYNPTPRYVRIRVDLALKAPANPALVKQQVESSITKLFSKKMDTLGRSIFISDIIRCTDLPEVDYCYVYDLTTNLPATNYLVTNSLEFFKLREIDIQVVFSQRSTVILG